MSYSAIVAALNGLIEDVTGIVIVLDYAPTAIHDSPLVYTTLDNLTISRSGQVITDRYRIQSRLVVRWQDNEEAESTCVTLMPLIVAAVEADPHLSGVITSGWVEIVEVDAVWVDIAGVTYRVYDFYTSAVEKR